MSVEAIAAVGAQLATARPRSHGRVLRRPPIPARWPR